MEKHEADLVRHREQMLGSIIAKHDLKMQQLLEAHAARVSNAEEIMMRQQQITERVREKQEHRQAETETKYWEIVGRHEKAQETRETSGAARRKEFKTMNNKAKAAHSQRWERLQQEIQNHTDEKNRQFQKSWSEAQLRMDGLPRERESIVQARESRLNNTDVAVSNRVRLRRSHHHSIEQQIDKLAAMREKTQVMLDAKATADERRNEVRISCAREKEHLALKVERVRDSGPERILKMLEELDLGQGAAKRINEILGGLGLKGVGGAQAEDDK